MSDLDTKVLKLMSEVKARRAKVGALKKPQWSTSCSLVLPGHERLNIQVCSDLSLLAYACGTLNRMAEDIGRAAKELDVAIDPKWQNYPIVDWVSDIKLRVRATQIKSEQQKLDALEAKLKKLTSPEQQRAMELADIEAELS